MCPGSLAYTTVLKRFRLFGSRLQPYTRGSLDLEVIKRERSRQNYHSIIFFQVRKAIYYMSSSLVIDVAATRCPDRCTWQQHTIDLGATLGSGRFATVRAVRDLQGMPSLAAKIIEGGHAIHEVELLKMLDHPHILHCFGLVQLSRYDLILVERCAGELFDRVQSMDSLDELQAARWMLELVSAVEHTHAHGVVHRDIKPENILLRTMDSTSPLVLSDFGGAKRCLVGVLHSPCGSRGYGAPETVPSLAAASQRSGEGYGTAADMWSCGVVAHVLLTGTLPTRAIYVACASEVWPSNLAKADKAAAASEPARLEHDKREATERAETKVAEEARRAQVAAQRLRAAFGDDSALSGVSNDAIDFLCALFRPHSSRLSASTALSHAWLSNRSNSASATAPVTTHTPSPPSIASPLLLTPKRLRETKFDGRGQLREGFRERASSGWSHADRRISHHAPRSDEEGRRHERSLLAPSRMLSVAEIHAEIPQSELPPPVFMRSKSGRSFASSARSLSAASGLDLLGHENFPRKRNSNDAGLPDIMQTPSTAAACPLTSSSCAMPAASAMRVATTPEPQLKRARSISSFLMDLQVQGTELPI